MLMKVRKDTLLQYCTWLSPNPTPPLKRLKNSLNRARRKAISEYIWTLAQQNLHYAFFLELHLAQIRRSERATIFNRIALTLNFAEKRIFFRNLRWGFFLRTNFLSSNARDTMLTENCSSLKKSGSFIWKIVFNDISESKRPLTFFYSP